MADDDKPVNRDQPTSPTGFRVPRIERKAEPPPPSEPTPSEPPIPVDVSWPAPPLNPTVADIYALIDQRLSPKIVERLSSAPTAKAPAEPPRASMPVRAAKFTGKWYAYVCAAAISIAQIIASAALPEYRGPIIQAGKLMLLVVAEVLKEDPAAPPDLDTPELLPEPWSPLPPDPE